MMRQAATTIAALAAAILAAPALAQPIPDYDFDWVTIGDVGNPGIELPPPTFHFDLITGRGSVDYEYRISTLEITTAQWMEYVNTFATTSDDMRFFGQPFMWGAEPDPTYQGPGERYRIRQDLADAERLPVTGISWRTAARYTNWLHNDKSPELSALDTGAYDTSTWGRGPGRQFTDDLTHLPDAKFWIPTLDEWLKAVHYDPDRDGPDQGGWWYYPNGTDDPLIPGLPGIGETSAGHSHLGGDASLRFPVGSYPDSATPWGLLDASGGGSEWTEEALLPGMPEERLLMGSHILHTTEQVPYIDNIYFPEGSRSPSSGTVYATIRVAGLVPAPTTALSLVVIGLTAPRRR